MSDPTPSPPRDPWPEELRVLESGGAFKITFDDGAVGSISAERLREASPSADKARKPAPNGRISIVDVEPVGNYAVRITFNDGHSTGIYTWRLLRSLATH